MAYTGTSESVPIAMGKEVEINLDKSKGKYSRLFTPPLTPKPSLLRRSTPSASRLPRASSFTLTTSQPSVIPMASSGFVQRSSTNVVTVPQHQSEPVEEIVLWDNDTEECEVIEVDEAQLQQLFQDRQQPESNMQQVILCDGDNVPFGDFLQSYFVEVVPNTAAVKKKTKVSKTPKKNATELKCLEEDCPIVTHNVIELRKHLQDDHDIEFEEESRAFASEEDFKIWRTSYERNKRVSFIYRGGTKKISADKAVTYLICHRSGYYKPTVGAQTERKRKLKPQGSCKIGTHCTAGIKLLKNLGTGTIEATICHTHYGHDNENIQHLRLNSVVRDMVVDKLKEGYSFRQLLEYVHHNPDGLQGMGVVDRRAIRNIYDQWRKSNEKSSSDAGNSSSEDLCAASTSQKPNVKSEPGVERPSEEVNKTEIEKIECGNVEPVLPSETINEDEDASPLRKKIKGAKQGKVKVELEDTKAWESETQSNAATTSISESFQQIFENISESTPASSASLKSTGSKSGKGKSATIYKEAPENVHDTIQKLLKHGDSGPTILYYKIDGNPDAEFGEKAPLVDLEDLCIVIQTPIQRQLLQMNGKIVNIEIIEGYDMDLMAISVLDEFLTSVPVAWMIVNQMSPKLIEQCFRTLQKNCVDIKCHYLLTTKKSDYPRLWSKVFRRLPKLILPQEESLRELRNLTRKYLDNREERGDILKLLEQMVTTPDCEVFDESLAALKDTTSNHDFLKVLNKEWLPTRGEWAFHKRLHIHTAVEESFMRLRKFILFKGTKKMKDNIHNILKIGYDRCFQRSKSLSKGDLKIQLTVDEIQAKHGASGQVEKINDNKYIVDSTYEVFNLETICACRLRCEHCEVCVHNYWCSCGDKSLCVHAHTVHQYCAGNFILKCEEESSDMELLPEFPVSPNSAAVDIETENSEDDENEGEAEEQKIDTRPRSASPELIIPEKFEPVQRISARIRGRKQSESQAEVCPAGPMQDPDDPDYDPKIKDDDVGPPKPKRGRGRPRRVNVKTEQKLDLGLSSTKTTSEILEETTERKESVREELIGLLGKLDNIHDARVMTEVKKRISDISAVVHRGIGGQL